MHLKLVLQINLCSKRDKSNPKFSVSNGNMRKFLGMLLLPGYHSLPHKQNYLSKKPDLSVPVVYNAMSKNHYFDIKKIIYFADNHNFTENDKISTISSQYEMLNSGLIQLGIFH